MGLLNLISDIDSYTKIEKQYGIGAADEFLKNRERNRILDRQRQEEQLLLRKQQMEYDNKKAVEDGIKHVKFDMSNQLRKNDIPLSDYELKKLHGIIDQVDYVYDQKTMNEICSEWNDFWYEKEFVYYVSIKVKDIQNKLINFLYNDLESKFNEIKEKDLIIQFDKIYNSFNSSLFINNLNNLFDYLKNIYDIELDKETISHISNEIKRVKKDWGKK